MNFRICRKHCRMTCIRVWTNMDRIGTTPYVVFYMHGSNDRSCTFIIQDRKFSEEFAKDIEDAIQKGEVSYETAGRSAVEQECELLFRRRRDIRGRLALSTWRRA